MTSTELARLRDDALDAADLHAKWMRDRCISPGSTLAKVLDPLVTEFLRARAANAAIALERETR